MSRKTNKEIRRSKYTANRRVEKTIWNTYEVTNTNREKMQHVFERKNVFANEGENNNHKRKTHLENTPVVIASF